MIESLCGLMGFAVATGLLFGRVSRPSVRIGFSKNALIAPYQDGQSLQFRIVNLRSNSLLQVEATFLMMTVDGPPGQLRRKFTPLSLERARLIFFPLTWTLVHPIDAQSPLVNLSSEDLARLQAEFLVQVRAYDDTFSQTVHMHYSYRHDDVVWGGRFMPAFEVNDDGGMTVYVDRVGDHAQV